MDPVLWKLIAGGASAVAIVVGELWRRMWAENKARINDLRELLALERRLAAEALARSTQENARLNELVHGLMAERERDRDGGEDRPDPGGGRRRSQGYL